MLNSMKIGLRTKKIICLYTALREAAPDRLKPIDTFKRILSKNDVKVKVPSCP